MNPKPVNVDKLVHLVNLTWILLRFTSYGMRYIMEIAVEYNSMIQTNREFNPLVLTVKC